VIGVHLFGQPCDIEALQEICESKSLKFIEDAAQAHGAVYKNIRTGSLGHLACFSFYATKNMITGEGGMVTTSDKTYNERLRLLINHGQSEKYLHTSLGYNYRMTDIGAALGIVQLKKLEKFNLRRRKNAEFYNASLSVKGLLLRLSSCTEPCLSPVCHQADRRVPDEPLDLHGVPESKRYRICGPLPHTPAPPAPLRA